MRVLHFYRTFFPASYGGVEQVIYQLCRGGDRFDTSAEVLTLGSGGSGCDAVFDGIPVHYAKTSLSIFGVELSRSAIWRFRELARQADVLHYHFPWPMADVVHLVASDGKPSVLTYHSDIVRQSTLYWIYRPTMRVFLRRVDRIVATSPNYLLTSPVLAQYHDKTSVIPIGLDQDSYPAPDAERLERWRTRLPSEFFLFVGMLRYYKGLHILLEALKNCPANVVIAGAGPIENELRERAHRENLGNVSFLGAVPDADKVALLTLCCGMVFPSHLRAEAFGVSLLEGAMHGKPMISTEIGTGTSHVNVDGVTGFVVPPGDAPALAAALARLLREPELAQQMGRNARARYLELFQAEQMCASYAELYSAVLR